MREGESQVGGVDVSRETYERLDFLCDLVRRWTVSINLIAPSTAQDIWSRHVEDSAQLFPLAPPFRSWLDLGSGGGFPGLVIAILSRQYAPDAAITLVESDRRKATFLRAAARELDIPVTVRAERIETLPPAQADILSARALAPLPQLLSHAARHLAPEGVALFLKGRRAAEEIAAARQSWDFDLTSRSSMTDPEAQVLRIERIIRV